MDGPRGCRVSEFAETMAFLNSVFRVGGVQDLRTDYPLVFDAARAANMRIVKADSRVVAHAAVAPRQVAAAGDSFSVGIIAPTATHPNYHHRGYGSACVVDCIRLMEELGCVLSVLWTQEATFPFYQRLGYKAVASQGWAYSLDPVAANRFAGDRFAIMQYVPADQGHLDGIMRLHERESQRIARSPAEYQSLFALPRITTYLAEKRREVLGYLMLGQGMNKPGIIEAGGEPAALEALVRQVLLEQVDDTPIQGLVPLAPCALGDLLEAKVGDTRRPIEEARGVGYQMVRVNMLRGFLEKISRHLWQGTAGLEGAVSLACTDTGETATISVSRDGVGISSEPAEDSLALSRRDLSRLFFGPHRGAPAVKLDGVGGEILNRVFPYHFTIWELDHC